jgi:lysozyme
VFAQCWLWVANYHRRPAAISPWSRWTLWQYTGDGVCDLPRASFPKSIANIRKAERNIFDGTSGDVRNFWQSHGWAPGDAREL